MESEGDPVDIFQHPAEVHGQHRFIWPVQLNIPSGKRI